MNYHKMKTIISKIELISLYEESIRGDQLYLRDNPRDEAVKQSMQKKIDKVAGIKAATEIAIK